MERIIGVYGIYYVDIDGAVYNRYGRKLRGRDNGYGYLQVRLPIACRVYRNFAVHDLVMRAYVGEKPMDCDVDHINFDRDDNNLSNLRYLSIHINRGRKRYSIGKEERTTVG